MILVTTPMVIPVSSRSTVMMRRKTRMRISNPALSPPADGDDYSDFDSEDNDREHQTNLPAEIEKEKIKTSRQMDRNIEYRVR